MAENSIRALVVTAHGGQEVLQVQSRPLPEPGPGEVRLEVAAAGVNFIDVYQRTGVYPIPTPFVLGGEGAGRVTALGDGVTDVAVGDLVATADASGAMAEAMVVAAEHVVPVPDGVTAEVAAAAMLQGMTAHYLVNSTYAVQPGDEVLVHAAAGGMGQLLVQLAKAKGAHVVATVGTAAKAAIASDLGADSVIRYDDVDDLAAAIRDASNGGVHVAYDGVGKATFDASLASLRRRGMMALFGAASGAVPPVDPQRLNSGGSLFLTRPTLKHYTATREELLWRSGEILGAIAAGELRISIGGRYPLDEAQHAYRDLEGRATTGKLLVLPRPVA
ncbi:MAG TPA: quinone oxidoreductase [Jatrophihabitantaceae bacterium]|jgi:NADPH2:quinone reductase